MNPKENITEQRQRLACVIARDGARERTLHNETQRLRMEIHDLEARDGMLSLPADATKAAIVAAQKGRDARNAKIAKLKIELAQKQTELDKVSLTVLEAHRALGPLEAKSNAERRRQVSGAIDNAMQQAPSRELFRAARTKFSDLLQRREAVEGELHALETAPPSDPKNVQARAAELLATGTMPESGPTIDGTVRRSELVNEARILAAAIRQQEAYISAAGRQFAEELAAGLRPQLRDVVERIGAGVQAAREATEEFTWLRVAVAVASGGNGELPACSFMGIPAPSDTPDAFDHWLTRMRLSGFEV